MDKCKAVKQWQKLSDETMEGMGEWREQNPKATLREIEKALDERMTKLRARVLEEAAQLSKMRTWTESENIPVCPDCKKTDEDVNSIEQGTGNTILVFCHNRRAQGQGNTKIYPGRSCNKEDFHMVNLNLFPQNMKPAMLAQATPAILSSITLKTA